MKFVNVILPLPLPKPYTYKVPSELDSLVKIGSRVIVQFGKKRILTAVIVHIHENPPQEYEAKYLMELLDDEPSFNSHQFELFNWIAEYYMCTIGEVLNAALPSGLKLSSESKIQLHPLHSVETPHGRDVQIGRLYRGASLHYTPDEEKIISALKKYETIPYNEVSKLLDKKNINPLIKSLIAKGAIIIFEEVAEKYKPKFVNKIRLNQKYVKSKKELENLFNELEKKPQQLDVLLKYLQHIPLQDNLQLNNEGLDKNNLTKSSGVQNFGRDAQFGRLYQNFEPLKNNPEPSTQTPVSLSALNTLIKNKIFEQFEIIVSRFEDTHGSAEKASSEIILTDHQQKARDSILKQLDEKEIVLLHGITGSGKTEIYIDLIQKALESGSQVLYLLPEIALTTQIVSRLRKVFGKSMGVYHSRFSDNERVEVWQGVISGKFSFVVGVRSSIFLPFDNLGLIIVDEEHDSSYKQHDPAPRYNAKDTALMLARLHKCKILLGSATPSVESYFQSKEGKYGLVDLKIRYGVAQLPEIILVDIRALFQAKGKNLFFSKDILDGLKKSINNHEQAILFQNRRGYAPYITCNDCAWIKKCSQCSVSLTYHMHTNELRCHYCGYKERTPQSCPACGSAKVITMRYGTEQIEEELKLLLPDANIQRMDSDTTRKKYSYQNIIDDFESRKTDILIGTQMVTKGLDFDNVRLVGIFDIDRMIHFPDFRSQERTFQMLTQVSGRSGRRDVQGKVIIQTSNPNQPVFEKIIHNDYCGLFENELPERKKYNYPPFSRLIKISVKHKDRDIAGFTAQFLAQKLNGNLGQSRVLGPESPLIDKIRNLFIKDIIIKLEKGKINLEKAKALISDAVRQTQKVKEFKNPYIVVDVDPV
ncbi:MAG: primosomal protein N' [Cytophagales bacterium]|nr:primosomal protein N' [Cytophagales bacterium]